MVVSVEVMVDVVKVMLEVEVEHQLKLLFLPV